MLGGIIKEGLPQSILNERNQSEGDERIRVYCYKHQYRFDSI